MSHTRTQWFRHLLNQRQALQQARGNSNIASAVMALKFGHLQSYQARGCYEWEGLCSRRSSPRLALLMLKMTLLKQVSCSVHWRHESGTEALPLG